jgi:hypothetical protein
LLPGFTRLPISISNPALFCKQIAARVLAGESDLDPDLLFLGLALPGELTKGLESN